MNMDNGVVIFPIFVQKLAIGEGMVIEKAYMNKANKEEIIPGVIIFEKKNEIHAYFDSSS